MSLDGGDMAKRKKAPGHIWPTDILDDGFTTVPHELPGALAGRGLTASAVLIVIHGLLRRAYRGPTVFPSLEDIAVEAGLSVATVKRQMPVIRESGVVIVTERGRNRSNVYDLTPLVEVVRQYRARRTSDASLNVAAATPKDASREEAGNVGAAPPDPADASGGVTQVPAQPEAATAELPTNARRPARFGKPVYDWERLDLTIPEELQKLFAAFEAEEAKPPDPERERRKHEVAAFRHAVHMKLGGYDRPVKHSPQVERILAMQARSVAGLE